MGSRCHASWLNSENIQVDMAIVLDQIGLFYDEPGTQRSTNLPVKCAVFSAGQDAGLTIPFTVCGRLTSNITRFFA